MDKISIAIVSDDRDYNRALSLSLVSISRDLSIGSFGSRQFVSNWSKHEGDRPYYENFDLVLWAGEEIREAYGGNIVFLSEKESDVQLDFANRSYCIYKYQGARQMAALLFDIYGKLYGGRSPGIVNEELRIFAFASARGGAGCTTLAMAAAQELCRFRNRSVLYLSLEDVESTGEFFSEDSNAKAIGEYLYRLLWSMPGEKKQERALPYPDSFLLNDMFGVKAFNPSAGKNPLRELNSRDMNRFINAMMSCGRFDTILIDLGSCLTEAAVEAMEASEKICFITAGEAGKERELRYLKQLSGKSGISGKMLKTINMHREGETCDGQIAVRRAAGTFAYGRDLILEGGFGTDIERMVDLLLGK